MLDDMLLPDLLVELGIEEKELPGQGKPSSVKKVPKSKVEHYLRSIYRMYYIQRMQPE